MIDRLHSAPSRFALSLLLTPLLLLTSPRLLLAQGGPPPPSVRVVEAKMSLLAPSLELPGTVVSRNDAKLSAEVPGQLLFVAEVGTVVEQGEVVARIDDTYLTLQRREYTGIVASRRASRRRHRYTNVTQFGERLAAEITVQKVVNAASNHLADLRHLGQCLGIGLFQLLDVGVVLGQNCRNTAAHMANRQRVQQPRQPAVLAGLDAGDQLFG